MTEHLIVNRLTGEWSSIVFEDNSNTALVVTNDRLGVQRILNWTTESALITLRFCQMYPDTYEVEIVS